MAHLLRVLVLLPVLAAAVGCGSTDPVADDQLSAGTYPPDALVVQVSRTGGFQPVGAAFSSLPSVSVYGDGRVVTPGAQIAVHPAPALPSVQAGRLDAEQVRELVEDGRAALAAGGDYGQPPVADAPTTVVVVGAGDDREVARAVALDELASGPGPAETDGLTPAQREARERLSAFVRQAEDVATDAATEPYEAERMAVLAMPYDEGAPAGGTGSAELPWPGPPLAEGEPVGPSRCVVVTGEELDPVRRAAADASQETAWTAGGQVWRLAFRPLLPHEQSCADVLDAAGPPSP